MLSHYVYRCGDGLLNLTTKKLLPFDANEEELRSNFFLAGQERDALNHALFVSAKPDHLSMKLTPTWRCNLRCRHCFVLDKLTNEQGNRINISSLVGFVNRFVDHFPDVKTLFCCFVGGEVTLEVGDCLDLTERLLEVIHQRNLGHFFSTTTNGTVLNRDVLEFFNRCGAVTVSIDGSHDSHNWQRKPVGADVKGKDVYRVTTDNLRRLVKLGMRDKLGVQAALYDSETEESIKKFFFDMVKIGIRPERIKLGAVAPTKQNPEVGKGFAEYMGQHISAIPCCNWRLGREFMIDNSNTVYCDYYQNSGVSAIGNLDTPIDTLIEQHRLLIEKEMTILQDPVCLACPVVGACWGRCCYVVKANRPSEVCDQEGLKRTVAEKLASGEILSLLQVNKHM